ncbi:hypothetical protein QWY85_05060 [Neolewinella lacunae]|uniref:Uncharacterized protein n=1 Tax=Neolewinella lacunae TaxID=1517758 RepID=A0A923PLA5_9BACT|nr:hypothetical protein [Neolewinella lacunae]MBC6996167.1 hypothetical protein [Neolewinella lacunae]MDN3634018.1 hypothetical protein [Neolewinella lacunae]
MNSFLQLQDQDIQLFVSERQEKVREVVESRVKATHYIADIVELFFPRLADTLTVTLGGEAIEPNPEYFTIRDAEDQSTNSPSKDKPAGPGDRDEIIR